MSASLEKADALEHEEYNNHEWKLRYEVNDKGIGKSFCRQAFPYCYNQTECPYHQPQADCSFDRSNIAVGEDRQN